MSKLNFENAYVTFEDKAYKSKVGIPTGGSLSRQIADIYSCTRLSKHSTKRHQISPQGDSIRKSSEFYGPNSVSGGWQHDPTSWIHKTNGLQAISQPGKFSSTIRLRLRLRLWDSRAFGLRLWQLGIYCTFSQLLMSFLFGNFGSAPAFFCKK